MKHHPVFFHFTPFRGYAPKDFDIDFVGSFVSARYESCTMPDKDRIVQTKYPSLDDEYFEWITLLKTVVESKDHINIVELGSGYGRWAARSAKAAHSLGKTTSCLLVEAEPQHAEWAREHLDLNEVTNFEIIEGAVSSRSGTAHFLIEDPEKRSGGPRIWYGQALDWEESGSCFSTEDFYFGRKITKNAAGWSGIEVNAYTLADLLSNFEIVNLVDMDVQGVEAEIIECSIDVIDAKIKRLHIGTHNTEVEGRIRKLMSKLEWKCEWDFPCHSRCETLFGSVDFVDGVQVWRNRHL